MPDHDVRAHLDRRPDRARLGLDELDAFLDRIPAAGTVVTDGPYGTAHLVMVPVVARDDQAYASWSSAPNQDAKLRDLATSAHIPGQTSTWLQEAPNVRRAAGRFVISNCSLTPGGTPLEHGRHSADNLWSGIRLIELTRRGTVRSFHGGVVGTSGVNSSDRKVMDLQDTFEHLRNALNFAAVVGDWMRYGGIWSIALLLDGLEGAYYGLAGNPPQAPEAEYRASTTAATSEIRDVPEVSYSGWQTSFSGRWVSASIYSIQRSRMSTSSNRSLSASAPRLVKASLTALARCPQRHAVPHGDRDRIGEAHQGDARDRHSRAPHPSETPVPGWSSMTSRACVFSSRAADQVQLLTTVDSRVMLAP